ncbi:hypothetical protein PV11_03815 [Exophiala sideris]|uniref:Potassium channel tetramerisation-type BTB domain-containing protein n=1 Tax=Exophiala sideris TaxID=1016849 RepID=A0A0D1VYZ8_9EURO|nr:hypothetical protein PV11_03815 [Exophiala sideris]
MTDPQLSFDFEGNVNYSDTPETDLTSPAISISSATPGRRTSTNTSANATGTTPRPAPTATNQSSGTASTNIFATVSDRNTDPADTANPSPDTRPAFLSQHLAAPTVTPLHATDSEHLLAASSTDAAALARHTSSSGTQHWPGSSRPVLDFAPQPIYELTGELILDDIQTFDDFDVTTIPNFSSVLQASTNSLQPNNSTAKVAATSNVSSAATAFLQPTLPRSALKRKASSSTIAPTILSANKKARHHPESAPGSGLETTPANNRTVTFERMSGLAPTSPDEGSASSDQAAGGRQVPGIGSVSSSRRPRQSAEPSARPSLNPSASSQSTAKQRTGTRTSTAHPPSILPPEKVFPIQIGSELFRLSGASISSDAPSYFTQFFEEQIRQNEESGGVRTLYIDRDPITFRDVARHLQGYYVKPIDGSHFVKLFADAQFYSLPRLIDQLFESEIFIQIGERHFQIPKDIFSEPGNSPNFFSLGFAVFFSTPGEVFPGLDRRGLLRPPSITPPYVPGRSADIFGELLHLLRGYPLHVRNESHRAELLRDCRYFHLRGLEQKIIAHEITYNPERQKQEICLRLDDVKPSGVSYTSDDTTGEKSNVGGWVYYARPFVDDTSYEMVIEIGGESTLLDLTDMRADFHGLSKARVSSLFQVVANKMNLPTNAPLGLMMLSGGRSSHSASPGHTPLSEDRVKVRFDSATDITLDGERYDVDWGSQTGQVMLHGPSIAPSESESESDIMSEGTTSKPLAAAAGGQQRRPQTRQTQAGASSQAGPSRGSLPAPQIQTSRLSEQRLAKKRKRQSSQGDLGEWTIRTGQWRLRVQPNPSDAIRGGYELVFIGVKIDAYSNERARNARRGFLS